MVAFNRAAGLPPPNVPIFLIIRQAYEVLASQVLNAPDWVRSEGYDIVAKAPAGVDPSKGMPPLLRTLLNDRFGFKAHTEAREMPIYQLVLARRDRKLGPKLAESPVDCTANMTAPARGQGADGRDGPRPTSTQSDEPPCAQLGTPGRTVMRGFPIAQFARMLGSLVDRPVIDKTGLTGSWNLELEFTPEQTPNIPADALPPGVTLPSADAPSVFTALQEQLGLKLQSARGSVEVLLIERVERPTED